MLDGLKWESILTRMKNDDKSAMDELFHYFYPRLYHFSKKMLKLDTNIDDLLQEVFVKVWTNRHKITKSETFNAYIYTITRNEVLNLLRSSVKNQRFKEALATQAIAPEYQTDNAVDFNEVKQIIDQAVSTLPEKRKEVFLLSRNDGFSNKEIAIRLNISEKTVEDHITHAIKHIKSHLAELGILGFLAICLFL